MYQLHTEQKRRTFCGVQYVVTYFVNFEGRKLWGFATVPDQSVSVRQSPNWETRKEAIGSAEFHINLRLYGN